MQTWRVGAQIGVADQTFDQTAVSQTAVVPSASTMVETCAVEDVSETDVEELDVGGAGAGTGLSTVTVATGPDSRPARAGAVRIVQAASRMTAAAHRARLTRDVVWERAGIVVSST